MSALSVRNVRFLDIIINDFLKFNSIKRPIYHLTKLLPHTLIRFISPPKLQLSE